MAQYDFLNYRLKLVFLFSLTAIFCNGCATSRIVISPDLKNQIKFDDQSNYCLRNLEMNGAKPQIDDVLRVLNLHGLRVKSNCDQNSDGPIDVKINKSGEGEFDTVPFSSGALSLLSLSLYPIGYNSYYHVSIFMGGKETTKAIRCTTYYGLSTFFMPLLVKTCTHKYSDWIAEVIQSIKSSKE